MGRRGDGHIYKAFHAWHVRYYATEVVNGAKTRTQKSHRLCDAKNHTKTEAGDLAHEFLRSVKLSTPVEGDITVREFWDHYIAYCEETVPLTKLPRLKPSTTRGYRQIWNQHLRDHFADVTLREYSADRAADFLESLTGTQCLTTLKHIRAVGGSIFKRALKERRVKANPWSNVAMPEDAISSDETEHYTLEETEDIVSALVDHVDAQIVMVLACWMGLRPGEIAALKWQDFDAKQVHIRRSVVRGVVASPKTKDAVASLPLLNQVRVPLELWRQKNGNPTEGWVFPSARDTPVDLHNLAARVIRPHIEGTECVRCESTPKALKTRWKSLYSGRRGAITAIIELNDGDAALGQAWARHRSMATTLKFYKKAITKTRLLAGVKRLEAGS
ncbi:MAG: tyrosine-type recombinase/integrase [Terriglobales bacterium]